MASGMVAAEVGLRQGMVQLKPAAKFPVPVPLDWKTKVRQPEVLNTVPLTTRPCSEAPEYEPKVMALVLSPS
jgi:hypothetical protein